MSYIGMTRSPTGEWQTSSTPNTTVNQNDPVHRFIKGVLVDVGYNFSFADRSNLPKTEKAATELLADSLFENAGNLISGRPVKPLSGVEEVGRQLFSDPGGFWGGVSYLGGQVAGEVATNVLTMGAIKGVKGVLTGARAGTEIVIPRVAGRIGGKAYIRTAERLIPSAMKTIEVGKKYAPITIPSGIKQNVTVFLEDGAIARIGKNGKVSLTRPSVTNMYNLGERIEKRATELGFRLSSKAKGKIANTIIGMAVAGGSTPGSADFMKLGGRVLDEGMRVSGGRPTISPDFNETRDIGATVQQYLDNLEEVIFDKSILEFESKIQEVYSWITEGFSIDSEVQ